MFFQPLEYHSVYSAFKELNSSAFHSVIRLFEERFSDVSKLPAEEAIEVKYLYSNALFETGKYDQHIGICREVLEDIIAYNCQHLNGYDLYYECLTKLALSYHRVGNFVQSEHVYQEILKIYPYDKDSILKFRENRLTQVPTYLTNTKALCIFSIFLASFIIIVQVLVIKPFFPELTKTVFYTWVGITSFGVAALGFSYLYFYMNNLRSIRRFLHEARVKKFFKKVVNN